MPERSEFQRSLESIEELIHRIEAASDPHVRSTAQELVQAVMDLHVAGLKRIVELIAAGPPEETAVLDRLSRDDLVSSLLILHGLHPKTAEERLRLALDRIGPSLRKRGGEVELLACTDGAAKLRLRANGHVASLKELVEGAAYQAAPDIDSLTIEAPEDRQGFVPLEVLSGSAAANGRRRP